MVCLQASIYEILLEKNIIVVDFSSMFEEQRQEKLDDGFEQDTQAMLDKLRNKFADKPDYSFK